VDQATGHMEPPSQQPKKQQNSKNGPKHVLLRRGELRLFGLWMPRPQVKLTAPRAEVSTCKRCQQLTPELPGKRSAY
jgi:hypothetical protein